MHTFNVVPLQGVGPVRLGMTRAESRAAMALPVETYRKTPESRALTDAYLESAFQVFFDEEDRVEFIELSRDGPCVALYRDVRVFDLPADEVIALVSRDAPPELDDSGDRTSVVFPALELSLWRPFTPDDDGADPFDNDEDWEAAGFQPVKPEPDDSAYDGSTFATVGIGRRGYFSGSRG